MGAPMSRQCNQRVRADYFMSGNSGWSTGYFGMKIPGGTDLQSWLEGELKKAGYKSWEDADAHLPRSHERALVYDRTDGGKAEALSPEMNVHCALVLGRCSQHFYQPDGPLILTRKRLQRQVRLLTIQTNDYYELD